MKVSLDGLLKNSAAAVGGMWKHSLLELLENLRELRQRTQAGDMVALEEFFKVYGFTENKTGTDDAKKS